MKLKMMTVVAGMTLAGCAGPTPPAVVTLPNGQTGQQIYTSMQTSREANAENSAGFAAILEGPGRGNLADRAMQACPGGYEIAARSGLESRFTMVLANGIPNYRVSQTYTVVCT